MKMRLVYVFVLVVFFTGSSCSKGSGDKVEPPVTKKESLKVMTYNIRIGELGNLEAISNVIKSANPDLVALQEVDRFTSRSEIDVDQAKKLGELTDMHYYFAKAIDRSNGDYGVAILSKFPIKSSSRYSLPVNQGTGAEIRVVGIVQVELPNKQKVVFVSTHFDHLAESNRELQSTELLKAIKPYSDYPVIVGGDFNMLPTSDTWNILKTELSMGCTTCQSTAPASNPTRIIDYLLLNKTAKSYFTIKSYSTILERHASDHLPVVAELEYQD